MITAPALARERTEVWRGGVTAVGLGAVGVTGGLFVVPGEGVRPYVGLAFGAPGTGVTVSKSLSGTASGGWSDQFSGGYVNQSLTGGVFSTGGFDSHFVEAGPSVGTPGVTGGYSIYYTW